MGIPALAFFKVEITAKLPSKSIENPQTIGEHLKKRRQELKLLQKDVSKILNVSEDTITYWENGRSKPLIYHYPKIIEFLGYNPFPFEIETLGGRIKLFRIENGISQEKLAKMIGVDETTILAWEANKHRPLPSKMKSLEGVINQKELS